MENVVMQRYENEAATDDLYPASVWIQDARLALCDLMSQCKEMWSDPNAEEWCKSVRADAFSVIQALEQLQRHFPA